jgi:hypothetical protein
MTFDLYFILVGFGLAICTGAPLYLYFNLIMAMAELDSEEKEKKE